MTSDSEVLCNRKDSSSGDSFAAPHNTEFVVSATRFSPDGWSWKTYFLQVCENDSRPAGASATTFKYCGDRKLLRCQSLSRSQENQSCWLKLATPCRTKLLFLHEFGQDPHQLEPCVASVQQDACSMTSDGEVLCSSLLHWSLPLATALLHHTMRSL